jgi:glycosyltransferase involved in cell wall biosynthesis
MLAAMAQRDSNDGPIARAAVTLAIPTLNEACSIGNVVRGIPRDVVVEIMVADGGSTDTTVSLAESAGARVIAAGRGYGRACWQATLAAAGAEIMVFMDGDGADEPSNIATLVRPILRGDYDFVIGSRVRGDRAPGSMSWHQVAAGRLAGLGIRLLTGAYYTDMCAFRAIRRDALLDLGMREMGYGWNIEMQIRAAQAGLRILELPVPYHCRAGGASKVAGNLAGTLRAGSRIIMTFWRVAVRRRVAAPLRKQADAH